MVAYEELYRDSRDQNRDSCLVVIDKRWLLKADLEMPERMASLKIFSSGKGFHAVASVNV